MRKIYLSGVILALAIPFTTIAIVTPPNSLYRKSTVSGEYSQSGTTKTSTGKTKNILTGLNINAVKEVTRPKSRLETAAERQRQRQADLDNQHKEQREQEDRQRAIKDAYDAMKQAEERARQAELEKRHESETIEAYCDRANRQGFLERRLRVKTVNDCISRLKSFEKVAKKIVGNKMKEAMERKRFGDRLKKLCIEEYIKTGKVPEYCANVVLPNSGSGNTQSGGVLTRR